MNELLNKIQIEIETFNTESAAQAEKGNKSAGARPDFVTFYPKNG